MCEAESVLECDAVCVWAAFCFSVSVGVMPLSVSELIFDKQYLDFTQYTLIWLKKFKGLVTQNLNKVLIIHCFTGIVQADSL